MKNGLTMCPGLAENDPGAMPLARLYHIAPALIASVVILVLRFASITIEVLANTPIELLIVFLVGYKAWKF
jgi:hypothetical protein